MTIAYVKVKVPDGSHQECDHGEVHIEEDYEYVDKEIVLDTQDYIEYFLYVGGKEIKEKYDNNADFKKGFIEAIKLQDLDNLEDYDEDFKDFIQEKYGD